MEQLTLKMLKEMTPSTIFKTGVTTNDENGVYMTDNRKGHSMRWVAVRGGIHDWCIYIHWVEHDENYIYKNGDKVRDSRNIRKLINCDDEAMAMYRF